MERFAHAEGLGVAVAAREGEVTDWYIGISLSALRIRGNGKLFRWLLSLPLVRVLELPPELDLGVEALLEATIADLGTEEAPNADAPLIAILAAV
jgi:hypothetical protein